MPIVFFTSSAGDTDLAYATIAQYHIEVEAKTPVIVIPVTQVAKNRAATLNPSPQIRQVSLEDIVQQPDILSRKKMHPEELVKLTDYLKKNKIDRAYIGVPSPLDEEKPFQIAYALEIHFTVAYEYMFNAPASHAFWSYLPTLAAKENSDFAVPLPRAAQELENRTHNKAKVHIIGHLSIDNAFKESKVEVKPIRSALAIEEADDFIFISGTTQPTEVDKRFLNALLTELGTGKYPGQQIRLGVHPAMLEIKPYIEALLAVCEEHPQVKKQFKIILPNKFKDTFPTSEYFLYSDITGANAAQSADKIAQAVPGALLNEAALRGKPVYFHEKSSAPYLPASLFENNIPAFFNAKRRPPFSREALELKETAPSNMLRLLKQ